jgi:CheY-like chemotaxis protein
MEKRPQILMLEHDADDRFITRTFFEENSVDAGLEFAQDKTEFFSKLESMHADLPALILLNMTAGPVTAIDVLKQLKSDKRYIEIPAVVLCGGRGEDVIRDCYQAGASSVIRKPHDLEGTNRKIMNFVKYWFETVELL